MSVQAMPAVAVPVEHTPVPLTEADHKRINRLTGWNIGVAVGALSLGAWIGVLQGLEHTGLDLYQYLLPGIKSYYQGLTIHGVLNALIWTTFFICGFFTFVVTNSL